MKRFFIFSALAFALFLLAVSCSKEQDIIVSNPETEGTSDDSHVQEGTVLTFTVSTEYEETKTTWDGSDVIWVDEETVKIMYGNDNADKATGTIHVNGETGDVTLSFTVPDGHNENETFYAVSPEDATATLDNGSITVTIPEQQGGGSFASANIMAAKVEGGSGNISFKALSHVIKFNLSAKNVYDRFYFTANKNSTVNLVGTVTTDFSKTEDVLNVTPSATGKYVDVSGLTTGSAQTYYFAVLPGQDLSKGIAFKAHNKDAADDTWQVGSYSTQDYKTTDRLKITNIGTLDTKWIRTKWFIKTDGSPTGGASWDAPGNATRLVNLLAPANVDPVPASWKLFGVDIYVAEGDYNLQAANGNSVVAINWGDSNVTSITGGYPGNSEGTTLAQDIENNETRFFCRQTVADDRIFNIKRTSVIKNLTFDGIQFIKNPDISEQTNVLGEAFLINTDNEGKLSFNNCQFSGFNTSANGGPIKIQSTGAMEISFVNCSFLENHANVAGAVYAENVNAITTFENCIFDGNSSTKGAGSIRGKSGSLILDHCAITGVVENEEVVVAAENGGAIYCDGAIMTLKNNTTISKCKVSEKGGAIYNNQGTLVINNCTISSCSAASGAAIINLGSSTAFGKLIVYNSLFSANTTSGSGNDGGCIQSQAYGRTFIANSTIRATAGTGNGSAITANSSANHPKIYIVSCTLAENVIDFNRNYNQIWIYNSIGTANNPTAGDNAKKALYYSIWKDQRYAAGGTTTPAETVDNLGSSCLKTFDVDHYPLVSSQSAHYSGAGVGMTVDQLKALSFSDLDIDKSLLAKDQKGTPRTGTIMGAYVLTE